MDGKDPIDGYIAWILTRIVGIVLIFAVLGLIIGHAFAGMVTACSHSTPPTLVGSEKEQDIAARKYYDREAAKDELCSALPPLTYLPYAYETRRGDWTFRFYLFWRNPWSS